MVHDIREHSRKFHAYLFVDYEPLLQAQVYVEVSQTTDPAAAAASVVETEEEGPNVVIDRCGVF